MLLYSLCLIVLIIYLSLKYIYSYWDRHGLPSITPIIPFGNMKDVAIRKASFGVAIYNLYKESKRPFEGVYLFFTPAILVRDAHLVKQIMTTEFSSFHDRAVYRNEEGDPFSGNLFSLAGDRWKEVRQKLSPTFTSGKLKNMMPTILDVGKNLTNKVDEFIKENKPIEIKDLAACYSVDIIASVIFGVEVDTINNPENEFRNVMKSFQNNFLNGLRAAMTILCPKVIEVLGIYSLPGNVRSFLYNLVKGVVEYRDKNHVTRKDFMQLLIDLREEDKLQNMKPLTLVQCAAHMFAFYIAGSDSSSSAIAFCLYELSQNPNLIEKLQADIDEALQKHNGEITYDTIKDMQYLEYCILETIRKYPFPILNRECTKAYKIPDSDYTIEKGTSIIVSLMGINMDAKYFPEPDKFMPERFSDEHKNYDENAFFPFGDGPHQCIGTRLAKMMVKVGLICLLSKYNFEATEESKFEFDPTAVTLLPKNGIYLKVTKRQNGKI